jgi:hypothetical protein
MSELFFSDFALSYVSNNYTLIHINNKKEKKQPTNVDVAPSPSQEPDHAEVGDGDGQSYSPPPVTSNLVRTTACEQ